MNLSALSGYTEDFVQQGYAWEATYVRSWDTVQEDEAGSIRGSVQDLIARGRRRRYGVMSIDRVSVYSTVDRLLAPAAAIRRTIIRHLVLVLDLSAAMMDRDMRPTRFDLMLQYAREFVTEWFDQNPLGQIGIVGMRGGLGERIGEMSGKRLQAYLVAHIVNVHPRESPGRPQGYF